MREQYIGTGQGFMLVYSITSRQSFEEILTFREQILKITGKNSPIIVVGNHCTQEPDREVSFQEGQSLAREFRCRFVEVDSESRKSVDHAFFELVREIQTYEEIF
jgi:GTPase KRas protein